MKLTSQTYIKKEYANQTVMFPIVGTVQFDSNGDLEIEDDKVDAFISATNDPFAFAPLSKQDHKKVKVELVQVEPEDTKLRELLNQSGIAELAAMAHDVGVETEDIANMTDAKLRIVLYNKVKELDKLKPKQPDASNTVVKKPRKKRGSNKPKNKPDLVAE